MKKEKKSIFSRFGVGKKDKSGSNEQASTDNDSSYDREIQEDKGIDDLWSLLDSSKESLNLKSISREMIFLIGNTRSGKSTLRMMLCGNSSKKLDNLTVVGDPPCIVDSNGEIGDGSGYSCTSVPTIFQSDGQRSVTWVDAPGWGDNRSPFTDIVGMYLLNQVANQGKFYKFLVVIPYPAFYRDSDRKLRLDPLKFAIQIVGHVTDTRSVGVVVTKVDVDAKVEKVMDNISVGLKSLIRKNPDATTTDNNGGRPTLSTVIESILQNNRIYLVRRPNKKDGVASQPLSKVLSDPKIKKSKPYYEAVCQGLTEFCTSLKFVGKLENFTVTPSDATKMELQQHRLPELNEEMIGYVKKLVTSVEASVREQVSGGNMTESLEEVLKRLTDGLQQTAEFCKLAPAVGNTQCSQIIQKCARIFEIKMCPELLARLEKVEERFRFLQEITQVYYSGTLSCREEIVWLRKEFHNSHREILKEHGKVLRPKLERMINEQVERHIEHIKEEYGARHKFLLENGKVHQGLAVNKVEAHMISLHELLTSSDGQCFDTPGAAMEKIYEALVLAVGDGVREQLHQLNLAHTNFVELEMLDDTSSGRWSEPVKRVQTFLQTLKDDEILKDWKDHIQVEMEKEIAVILKVIKDNWLLGVGICGEDGVHLGTRIKNRMEVLSQLASFSDATLHRRDASFSTISEELCKLVEQANLTSLLTIPREHPIWCMEHVSNTNFEDVEKNCLSLWRAGFSELRAQFQLLHSVYQYLDNMLTYVTGNYEAQRKLKQMKAENSTTISELISLSLSNGYPKAPANITEAIGDDDSGDREQAVCKEIFKDVSVAESIWLGENVLFILGKRSVHLSDFLNAEYSLAKKRKQLSIFIVAGETLFVDKDWIEGAGEIRNVLICASQLKCVGQHKFVLVGAVGRGGLLKGNLLIVKSAEGHTWGEKGQDGLDGGCGGQGANICMVLDKVEKEYPPPLEINCQGGKGGFGMNGGDGHCGFGSDVNSIRGFNELLHNLRNFDQTFKMLCDCFYLQEASNIKNAEYQLSDKEEVITSNSEIARKVQLRMGHLMTFTFCSFCLRKSDPPDALSKDHCFCAMLRFPETFNLLWERPNLFSEKGVAVDKYQDLIESFHKKSLDSLACKQENGEPCPITLVQNLSDDNFFHNYFFKPLTYWRALSQPGITFQPVLEYSRLLCETCHSLSDDLVKSNALPKAKKGDKKNTTLLKKHLTPKNRKKGPAKGVLFRASKSSDDTALESGGVGGKGGDGGQGGCPGSVKIYKNGCLDKDKSCVKVHSIHGPSGNPGLGGTGGQHGQQKDKKIARANDGTAGKPATTSEACQRDCKNENWETEIAHTLWECIGKMEGSARQLLISRLETHDWAMRHLFTVEFWVDQYLSLQGKINSDGGYFTKSHLQEELAFQEKLEKFQLQSKVDESEEKVIRFLVKNSHDRTTALQSHVECTPCVVNLRENLDNCKAIEYFTDSKRYATNLEHVARMHEELDKEISDSKEKMEKIVAGQIEEIQKTFEEQKQKYKEDLNDYIKLLERKGAYDKARTILGVFKMMLMPVIKLSSGGLGSAGGSTGGMVTSMLLLIVNISKPKISSAKALTQNSLYGIERLMRETPRMVRRQIEALERVTREQAVLNGSLQTSLEQLRDINNEILKCTVEPVGNAEEKMFLKCLGRLEETRKEMFRVIQWQRSCYPDSHELASVLDYLQADLITADTDADLYKKTKDSIMESMSELMGNSWEANTAKERKAMADAKFVPAVDMLLSMVKSKLGKDNLIGSDKWKMKEMLKELKNHLGKFVAGLPSEDLFKVGFEKIQQALDTRIKYIDGTKTTDEKRRMADFYAGFHFNAEELESYEISSEDQKRKLAKIQMLTRAELLIMEYQSIKWAFMQWAFPYADRYMSKPIQDAIERVEAFFKIDDGGNSTGGQTSEENVIGAAEECKKIVEHFADMYRKSSESVVPVDEAWCTTKFSVDEPFFEWKHDECGLDIRNLLLGRPTKFTASVRKNSNGKGAIKVNGNIDLRFSYKDRAGIDYQNELDSMMKHFVLEMTHSGVSKYRVNSKYYQISGEKMTLRGKVRMGEVEAMQLDVDGANDTRGKMKDFVLSPYTEWTFRLSLEHPDEHGSNPEDVFAELADKFAHLVNLQLVGWGRHLNESGAAWVKYKPTGVEKYYDKCNESL